MSEPTQPDREVFLTQTNDPNLLSLLISVLESAEIPHTVQGREFTGLMPFAAGTPGMVARGLASRIYVSASRLEEARALLEADFSGDLDWDAERESGTPGETEGVD